MRTTMEAKPATKTFASGDDVVAQPVPKNFPIVSADTFAGGSRIGRLRPLSCMYGSTRGESKLRWPEAKDHTGATVHPTK
ncbi:MAG TPA: hypothetical protein VEW69_07465, partial [Alphaproteobacteria bacterium]|nr:hypothetical protein [Alphaproteobacteria bacterium]